MSIITIGGSLIVLGVFVSLVKTIRANLITGKENKVKSNATEVQTLLAESRIKYGFFPSSLEELQVGLVNPFGGPSLTLKADDPPEGCIDYSPCADGHSYRMVVYGHRGRIIHILDVD